MWYYECNYKGFNRKLFTRKRDFSLDDGILFEYMCICLYRINNAQFPHPFGHLGQFSTLRDVRQFPPSRRSFAVAHSIVHWKNHFFSNDIVWRLLQVSRLVRSCPCSTMIVVHTGGRLWVQRSNTDDIIFTKNHLRVIRSKMFYLNNAITFDFKHILDTFVN